MRRSKPALAALALMLLGANSYSQSETNKPRATDQSVQLGGAGSIVKGRAVFEDTGQPAPKQRVQLVAVDLLTNRRGPSNILTTLTDANGEFVFTRAAAGDYYVVAHPADEHVSGAESAPFPVQTGDASADAARLEQYQRDFPRITVSGAGPVEINLRVKNPHFGAISGHILDANGAMVAGANVHAMKTGEGGFGLSANSDANGAYQFKGLAVGEYVISANPPARKPPSDGAPGFQGVLGATYFPSTIDRRQSPPVVVSPDLELGDINITLVPRSLHSVAGTVRAEGDGHPVAGAKVRLTTKEEERSGSEDPAIDTAMANYLSTTDAQGHWLFSNLPDGVYNVSVSPTALVSAKVERFVEKRQELTVAGADVENLAIEVSLGGRVSGHVTVERGNAPAPDISIGIGTAITRVDAKGDFLATGVPEGEFPLAVIIRPTNVFYAKTIEVNDLDLLRQKLKTGAAEIKDVRVVLAPASILTGRVLSASEKTPLSRVNVMLIPADPSKGPAFVRPNGSTNSQGAFLLSGAPGDYFVVLWSRGEPLPPTDVESIKQTPNAVRVTLGPGERKSIDLIK
ncbi:MAG TPA: carboxypeptidase-like regulatory domain-containing protein [Pyrinomonadaceae bacterium]|nr:carboxypeptidase-like regulatory domain-containing protein [Pyrinomonadaceae bacterium]